MSTSKSRNSSRAQSTAKPISEFSIQNSAFLPPGELTLLLGHPGTGKSLLAIDLAARLSRAQPLPFPSVLSTQSSALYSQSSLLLSLEDSPSTIHSRLLSSDADLSRILYFTDDLDLASPPPTYLDPHPQPSLLAALNKVLPTLDNTRLLILDPLPAFLGDCDCYSAPAVRRALRPLLQLAVQFHLAILGITHLNKSGHIRAAGSHAYTSLASHVFLVSYASHFPQVLRDSSTCFFRHSSFDFRRSPPRLLIPLKSPDSSFAFPFSITDSQHADSAQQNSPTTPQHSELRTQHALSAARIAWHSAIPNPLADCSIIEDQAIPSTLLDRAVDFLRAALAGGPLPSTDLQSAALTRGFSKATLHRARALLAIDSFRTGRGWHCALPPSPPNPIPNIHQTVKSPPAIRSGPNP